MRICVSLALVLTVGTLAGCAPKEAKPLSDALFLGPSTKTDPEMRLAQLDAAGRFTLGGKPAAIEDPIEPCSVLLVRSARTDEALAALTNLVETVFPRGCSVLAKIGPVDDSPFFDLDSRPLDDTPGLVRLQATTTSDGLLSWTSGSDLHHCTLDARPRSAKLSERQIIQSAGRLAASRPSCSVLIGFEVKRRP